jgi:RND family efflux transporter MFP subunit
MVRTVIVLFAALGVASNSTADAADEIEIPSVLIKLIEQVEVPARQAGVLEAIKVHEGQMVAAGAMLAQIEDADAQLDKRRAQLELAAARKQAESDVKVRYARKSSEVAESELRRALDSQRRLSQSVSQSELDQLRLSAQKSALEIEQSQLDLELAQTARELKENELLLAEHSILERRVVAPLAGFVVEVNRRRGEWVQPGQTVLRILRLDRLRAEGLVNANLLPGDTAGQPVKLSVRVEDGPPLQFTGKVVFVSPEIDPVNAQVRVWAEIDNSDLKLRPGVHGSLVIQSSPRAARGSAATDRRGR